MYDYGAKFKQLCEAQCRQFKVYADIYKKITDSEGNISYEFLEALTSSDGIVSIKIVRGQTSGGFSFGNAFSGELTLVVTAQTDIDNNEGRIDVAVSFINEDGAETGKAPLGVFFVQSVAKTTYTKTVKCVDGIMYLAKYYSNVAAPLYLSDLFYLCTRFAKLETEAQNFINNPLVSEVPIKDASSYDISQRYYTCREICNMIASANAGNIFINSSGKIQVAVPHFDVIHQIPTKSVISYTDNFTENKFTKTFWSATYEGTELPSYLDPQSSVYDPSVMVINFPLGIDERILSSKKMQANVEAAISGVEYSGIMLKKQGTGLYEIGDVVSFDDMYSGKSFPKIYIMGIVYEISASAGFTETFYSLAKTESQFQTQGISLADEIGKSGGSGGRPPVTGFIVNDYGDFTISTNKGTERYRAVF